MTDSGLSSWAAPLWETELGPGMRIRMLLGRKMRQCDLIWGPSLCHMTLSYLRQERLVSTKMVQGNECDDSLARGNTEADRAHVLDLQ